MPMEGPEAIQDDTFSAEDAARMQALSGETQTGTGAVAEVPNTMSGTVQSAPMLDIAANTGGTILPTMDPALRSKYDAIRTVSKAVDGNVYRVTNEFLNVRSAASVTAGSVGRLLQGDLVTMVEFVNAGWAKIKMSNGVEGFVATRYVAKLTTEEKLKEEEKAFEGTYFVDYAFVNVRKSADVQSEKMGEIPGQAFVKPLSIDRDWARVNFEGKEGYVSMQFLTPFKPAFLVRQDTFVLPILQYNVEQPGMLEALVTHAAKLKESGAKIMTLRELSELVMTQEVRDVRLTPKSVIIAVTGITAENVRKVSDALYGPGIRAVLFIQTKNVGLSGISEKTLSTLVANGFDIQSAGHTGDDLRALTNAQLQLELSQSRQLLEELTKRSVLAIAYPQGGVNERVMQTAAAAGYLFGIGSAPDSTFARDQFLRIPSFMITGGMTADDVSRLVK